MEDKSKQENEAELEPRIGSGAMLAAARKQQNKTVEEIATELNLSVTQIKTIELDQTDGLPEPTYVRGYIRSYAKLLGLESEQVLKNYLNPNWQQSTNLDDMPRGIASAEELSGKRILTPTKVLSFLLLVGLAAFLWYSGALNELIMGDKGAGALTTSNTSSPVIEAPQTTADQVEQLEADVTNGDVAAEAANDGEATVNDTINELVLEFSQTSWIDIRDVDDNRLAYKSYAEGESLQVSNPGMMSVFIGNAEGVTVNLNGASFDISGYREGVYAKFSVGDN